MERIIGTGTWFTLSGRCTEVNRCTCPYDPPMTLKQYETKMQLRKAVPSVYHFLRNQGWLDECFPVNSSRWKK